MRLVKDPDEHEAPERPDNVVRLSIVSSLDMDADTLLRDAIGQLDGVVIIGYTKGDYKNRHAEDEYFASSIADGATVLWLLERSKHKLLHVADELEEDDGYPPAA